MDYLTIVLFLVIAASIFFIPPTYLGHLVWREYRARRPDKPITAFGVLCMALAALFLLLTVAAIPDLIGFLAGPKSWEAKRNLTSIHAAQQAYFSRTQTYAGGPRAFAHMGWAPAGSNHYAYYCGVDSIVNKRGERLQLRPGFYWPASVTPVSSKKEFTCLAIGKKQDNPGLDAWSVNENKEINQEKNVFFPRQPFLKKIKKLMVKMLFILLAVSVLGPLIGYPLVWIYLIIPKILYPHRLNPVGFSPHFLNKLRGLFIVQVLLFGIVFSISIPNFFRYHAKAKQSEAKTNLGAIYVAQQRYFSQTGGYASGDEVFQLIQWDSQGQNRYSYYCDDAVILNKLPLGRSFDPRQDWPVAQAPSSSASGFTCMAVGNIDNEPTLDIWSINDAKVLTNDLDDV